MVTTPREELENIEKELKEATPKPLHTMLSEKQPKDDAIDLFCSRKRKVNIDCPPTCTGNNYFFEDVNSYPIHHKKIIY